MRTIIVDDDEIAMELLTQYCDISNGIQLVGTFKDADEALSYVRHNTVDFALLDVEMPGMNGLSLGEKLRSFCPEMVIIYVTGHSKYVIDMLRGKADYCIIKPFEKEDIYDAFERAKLLCERMKKSVRIVTFGRFEVYAGQKAIRFGNSKARELFAYCIHREGAVVSMEEAIDTLWPERIYDDRVKRLYRKAVGAISDTLKEYELQDCFENKRGSCQIHREKMECDLYQFLQGEPLTPMQRERLRTGYMTEYSWAEERMGEFLAICPELYEE